MNQTRKIKERDDLVHLLRQNHRNEIRKVMAKVATTEAQKGTPKCTGKSPSGIANRLLCINVKKGSYQ